MNLFLQIFLMVNVFLMGMLAAVAIRHARAHFKPREPVDTKPLSPTTEVKMPPMMRERIIKEAEKTFLESLNRSAEELHDELRHTSDRLNRQLQQLGSEVAISEKGRYSSMLEELRKRTEIALVAAQAELDQHQIELKAQMSQSIVAEQQRLVKQIDAKLADAVASFLTEALQHNVDLGTQSEYLIGLLEQHKEDFKREVVDNGSAAAK